MVKSRDLIAGRVAVQLGLLPKDQVLSNFAAFAVAGGGRFEEHLLKEGLVPADKLKRVQGFVNLYEGWERQYALLRLMKQSKRFSDAEINDFKKQIEDSNGKVSVRDLCLKSGKIKESELKNAQSHCLQMLNREQAAQVKTAQQSGWATVTQPLVAGALSPQAFSFRVFTGPAPAPARSAPSPAAPAPKPVSSGPPDMPAMPPKPMMPPKPGPATPPARPASAKAPAAKPDAVKAPSAKAPAAKPPSAKAPAAKPDAVKAPSAKAPSAKAPAAKPDAAKAPSAKAPAAKPASGKAPAAKAGDKPAAKPAAKPAGKPAGKPAAKGADDKKPTETTRTSAVLLEEQNEPLETTGMMLPKGAEILPPEAWSTFDIFSDIPANNVVKFLKRTVDATPPAHPIWIRRYKAGEIICHEGEHGSTAYYIVKGAVSIYISALLNRPEPKAPGFFSRLFGRSKKKKSPAQQFIPIDASVDLDMAEPVAQLKEGDIFGEMTALSFTPRSATVRASSDVVCFEMLRSVLQDLLQRRSKSFKKKLETAYRNNALKNHLKSVPVFDELPDDFIEELKNKVELVGPFKKGEVICKEGEPSDAFYLIRMGFVKVIQRRPGGDVVLAYLGRGSYFGEIGLLDGSPRSATCVALDSIELVRISRPFFMQLVAKFPEIRGKLNRDSEMRKREAKEGGDLAPTVTLDQFLDQGLMNAQNVLLIDLEKCTRCDECVRACADVHHGVSRFVRDGLRYDRFLVASACRSCTDPVCMIGCPVGSIRRRGSLEIRIEDWCIGCGKCANQCPYGNITMHDIPADKAPGKPFKAETCDLCGDVGSDPNCVYACPHDAAIRVEPRQFFGTNFVGGQGEF